MLGNQAKSYGHVKGRCLNKTRKKRILFNSGGGWLNRSNAVRKCSMMITSTEEESEAKRLTIARFAREGGPFPKSHKNWSVCDLQSSMKARESDGAFS